MSGKDVVRLRLVRTILPEPGSSDFIVWIFGLNLEVGQEDGLCVVDYFNGLVAATGKSVKKAVEEFADSFTALIDYHISEGTLDEFLARHAPDKVKTFTLTLKPDMVPSEEDLTTNLFPVWQYSPKGQEPFYDQVRI